MDMDGNVKKKIWTAGQTYKWDPSSPDRRITGVCLVHLYALEGGISNTEFNCLPEEKKKELKEFSDFLKR